MEIREFAERVLFSPSIDGKLAPPPEPLTDHAPGAAIAVPGAPGRPDNLRFAAKGERAPLPGPDGLKDDASRAALLHAFANHELLATELMALALLRFPDAPPAFRRGLVRTLRDEQIHTALYLRRLAGCGVPFGSLPVNGFFWRHISDMESPADYVSRLSLTFEQANLDYSCHFAKAFREAGDAATGELLDRIYRDEIAHVGYGLKWFRRWKPPGTGDWEAWQSILRFPLNPSRARGNAPFNAEGRRRAGLDEEFIANLQLVPRPYGRPPRLALFNPAAEARALTGSAATPAPEAGALASDLDILAVLLARPHDVALVHAIPSREHRRRLADAGIPLPEFAEIGHDGTLPPDSPVRSRRPAGLIPWGWSADSAALARDVLSGCDVPWDDDIRLLYSKATAAEFARETGKAAGADPDIHPVVVRSRREAEAAVAKFAASGFACCVCKAPFGLAGRGMRRVDTAAGFNRQDFAWLDQVLGSQECVVVEPWLERYADFSVQYSLSPGGSPRWLGFVRLYNSPGGRFHGCAAGPSFGRLLPPGAARALQECDAESLYRTTIPSALARLPGAGRLTGNLGIDAFLYRDPRKPGDALRLRPVVEINPRCTMGRITLELRRLAHPGRNMTFRLLSDSRLARTPFRTLRDYAAHLAEADPLTMDDSTRGRRITGGTLVLNDPARAARFLAIASVSAGPQPDEPPPPGFSG